MSQLAPKYLRHVTLNTGHQRDSRRDEISPEAMASCLDLIERLVAAGNTPLPHPEGYSVAGIAGARTSAEADFAEVIERASGLHLSGRCLTAAVYRDVAPNQPLALIAVADHQRCGSTTWANLRAIADQYRIPAMTSLRQPPTPWCAALLLPGIATDAEAAHWLGDFERCLGWAWVQHIRTPQTAELDELEEHALRPGGPARPW